MATYGLDILSQTMTKYVNSMIAMMKVVAKFHWMTATLLVIFHSFHALSRLVQDLTCGQCRGCREGTGESTVEKMAGLSCLQRSMTRKILVQGQDVYGGNMASLTVAIPEDRPA